ncbi:hypothetical protein pb186bvf_021143 [Paramecium bursaria]
MSMLVKVLQYLSPEKMPTTPQQMKKYISIIILVQLNEKCLYFKYLSLNFQNIQICLDKFTVIFMNLKIIELYLYYYIYFLILTLYKIELEFYNRFLFDSESFLHIIIHMSSNQLYKKFNLFLK